MPTEIYYSGGVTVAEKQTAKVAYKGWYSPTY